MITRSLIRVKVLQTLYCYATNRPDYTAKNAVDALESNFDRTYELYHLLLLLPIQLTDLQERRLDDAKHKFRPTEADLHPDTRFIDNALIAKLRNDETFATFCNKHHLTWADDPIFMDLMLRKVLSSDIYANYMAQAERSFESDCELWNVLMRNLLLDDDDLAEQVEKLDARWSSEDLDTMGQFTLKTIRRFQRHEPQPFSPQFNDEQDKSFGITLLNRTINELDENNELIDSLVFSQRWDKNRIALMDRLIMDIAITEMKEFYVTISPIVTLNEYIELAKIFSTQHSGQFVNGVLHKAAVKLDSQKKIVFWRPETGKQPSADSTSSENA